MSSSVHIDILFPHEGPTQRLDDATLTAEAKYPINFTQSEKKIVLCLHYNESNSFLFVNAFKFISIQSKKLRNRMLCTLFR